MNVVDNLQYLITSVQEIYDNNLVDAKSHKFAAHERLFKLVLNLSTLSITGWMAVVAWNFEPFAEMKLSVYISCLLFVASLLLVSAGDVCIMLQSLFREKASLTHKQNYYSTINSINSLIISHTEFAQITKEELHFQGAKIFSDDVSRRHSAKTKDETKATRLGDWSWIVGLTGFGLFFIAAAFLVVSMSNYVAKAQEIKAGNESFAYRTIDNR